MIVHVRASGWVSKSARKKIDPLRAAPLGLGRLLFNLSSLLLPRRPGRRNGQSPKVRFTRSMPGQGRTAAGGLGPRCVQDPRATALSTGVRGRLRPVDGDKMPLGGHWAHGLSVFTDYVGDCGGRCAGTLSVTVLCRGRNHARRCTPHHLRGRGQLSAKGLDLLVSHREVACGHMQDNTLPDDVCPLL